MDKVNIETLQRINEILTPNPGALHFIQLYNDYVHRVDDFIDDEKCRNPEVLMELLAQAIDITTTKFYRDNFTFLYPVFLMTNNTYCDSLVWEGEKDWRRVHCDSLRHTGYDMLFMVVWLVGGRKALREISEKFRHYSHNKHLQDFNINYENLSQVHESHGSGGEGSDCAKAPTS